MLKKYLGGLGSLRRCCGMSERESKTCPAVYQADFKKRGVINCDEVCWRRNRSGVRGIIQVWGEGHVEMGVPVELQANRRRLAIQQVCCYVNLKHGWKPCCKFRFGCFQPLGSRVEAVLDENTWGEIESGENHREPPLGVFGRAALNVDQGGFVRKLVKGIFQEPRQQSRLCPSKSR